jgi:hypothetical protein
VTPRAGRGDLEALLRNLSDRVEALERRPVPVANAQGGFFYVEGGALKWRSPAGVVTTVASQ